MQFWQQKEMYKQLQDLRQQQIQQLDQGARQQSLLSHMPAVINPVSLNQPATMNEVPIHNVPSSMWANNFVGGLPAVSNNSHMFVAGNMNWAQTANPVTHNITNGIMSSNNQSTSMKSIGYTPNQSFHGIPISSSRGGSMNHYSQLSEMSNDYNNLMTNEVGSQAQKVSSQFNSFQNNEHFISQGSLEDTTLGTAQNFQGKGFFGHSSVEILNNDESSINLQKKDRNQVFHGRQEQPDWSGNRQENPAEQLGASKYASCLDPTEQKFLFGTDDDNWGSSFSGSVNSSAGGLLQGLPFGNDYLGGFPSIQSGSWSALMQEAVQSSSSDKETQDEWSSLDFKKMEKSIFKPPIMSSGSEKQLLSWNNSNVQNASLTMKPLPLFNDTEAGRSSCSTSTFQPPFETPPAEHNRTQVDASHLPFQLSARWTNDKHLHQLQKQNQLPEATQVQVSENNKMWVGQSHQRQENSSSDMQHIQGSWTHQDLHMSNNARQSGNMPTDWNTSYQTGGDNSKFTADGNMPSFATHHANLNTGVQSVENNIGISQVHSEGRVGNYSFPTLNNENNQQMLSSQKVGFGKTFPDPCINSESNRNVKRIHSQNWELPTKTSSERLSDNYDSSKEHWELVSGEGYVSNRPYGHQSNIVSAEKEISSLTYHDQHSSQHEGQKSSPHADKQIVESNIFENRRSNMGMNVLSSHDGKNWSHFQGPFTSFIEESKSEEKIFTGKPTFNRQIVPNDTMDITKRIPTRTEEPHSRGVILVHDSTSFNQSGVNYSQSKNIVQTSENMLDLLHKVDCSGNHSSMPTPDKNPEPAVNNPSSLFNQSSGMQDRSGNHSSMPTPDKNPEPAVNTPSSLFNQSSGMQGFGLRLAPPSQRQQRSHFALCSQVSANDAKSRQVNKDVGDIDQITSTYAPPRKPLSPNESSERENLSNMSSEKHKEASEPGEELRSSMSAVSSLPYLGNQLHQEIPSVKTFFVHQHHQRHVSGSTGHEVSRQAVNFLIGNETNEHAVIEHSSPQWKPQDARDVVTNQSAPSSLSTPVRGIPLSRLAPLADSHVLASSNSSSAVTDNMKMVTGFQQVQNSGPPSEGRSGLQPYVAERAQQADFSRMLHNVWSNISAQQRLAGLHPAKLTPQVLQSIINNNRDTSSLGLQKGDDQRSKDRNTPEVGAGYSNMGHGDEHQIQGNFLKPASAEMDSSSKTVTSSQGEELAQRAPPGDGFSVSVSSLVPLHQQGIERGKGGQDSAVKFHAVNTSASTMPSSNGDIGLSGRTSMSLDARQINYSLLHQMQTKGSDFDPSKMLGKSKGTDFTSSSNVSQTHWNTSQKSVNVQNPSFCVPADDIVSASSQGAFPSDFKKLKFSSKHENSSTTSASTAGEHDLTSMQAHCTASATNLILGSEQSQIRSQMAPSWFGKYGNYKNGVLTTSANFNSQPSVNASAQCPFPKVLGMSYNHVLDQKSDNNEMITHRQSSVAANVATNEMFSHIAQGSKKRKRLTSKFPWHKLVTEGPQRLLSISGAELDWVKAANRFIEKVGDETDTEDGSSAIQPRRRLILTTQLMQQLLPSVPARILKEEATSSCESMTFYVAKSVLADACGILSLEARVSNANLENQSWTTKKLKTSKGDDIVEDFIERSKKLESDFLRLEKKTSLLDARLECQELERFSIVNRLGRFHSRPHTDVVEGSSNPEAASRRTFLQRYVTAVSQPGSLPEGVMCLSI